jgi:hypothetical protein
MTPATQLAELIESLPPDERQRVEEYIAFVSKERSEKSNGKDFRFDWAGGLSEFKGKYTSIELQKKAMEWMGGSSRWYEYFP